MRNVVTFVLGGGRGTRLFPLTQFRSKPAVPFGGNYRLIDIPLSNCINSGMRRIYVLTQFMSVSLHRHIRQTYRFDNFSGGFVEILAAQQTMGSGDKDWYQGTADAVRKNIRYLDQPDIDYVLILSGDQLYRMDYCKMVKTHVESGADVTIAAMPVHRQEARALGIMRLNKEGRVVGFVEKPQEEEQIDSVATDPAWIDAQGIPSKGRDCLASMGIYLFNRKTLVDILNQTTDEDFGKQIFPAAIETKHVQMHLFDGYWEDIGTIKAFYHANLELATHEPSFDLSLPEAPIFSHRRFLPPAQFQGATVHQSIIADGCKIGRGATIENSVIGVRCIIGDDVTIRDTVFLGADTFESSEDLDKLPPGTPPVGIGTGTIIEGAILDKNCRIGANARIRRGGEDRSLGEHCHVRDGVTIVVKDGIIPDGWTMD